MAHVTCACFYLSRAHGILCHEKHTITHVLRYLSHACDITVAV